MDTYCRLREEVSARTASQRAQELCTEAEIKSKQTHIQRLQVCFFFVCLKRKACVGLLRLIFEQSQLDSLEQEIKAGEAQGTEYTTRSEQLKKSIAESRAEKDMLSDNREKALRCCNSR